MATNQNPGGVQDPSQITPEELQTQLNSGLTAADDKAAQSMGTLKLVHQARVTHLTRTAAFLRKKYGAGDSRTKDAHAAVAAEKVTVARVSMLHQQVSTPTPQVPTAGWTLYGRVFNAQLQPVEGYTVFLVDAQKAYQQAYGFSYTDKTGYFQIDYAGPEATKSTASTPATEAPTTKKAASATPQLFVEVVNIKAQPVYLKTTAFQPVIGNATYQTYVLPAGEKPIGAPPAQIRKVAQPKRKKKKKA